MSGGIEEMGVGVGEGEGEEGGEGVEKGRGRKVEGGWFSWRCVGTI